MKTERDRLIVLIANALRADPGSVSDVSGLGHHPQWDSLGHIAVMVSLEDAFGIRVDESNIAELTSVAAIRRILGDLV